MARCVTDAQTYQKEKADVDVVIALRRLDVADLKVAIGATDDQVIKAEFIQRIKIQQQEIALLNVAKASIKTDYYGVG